MGHATTFLTHWLVPRDKPGLLIAVMKALAGDAHISFEGDLRRCVFPPDIPVSEAETAILRRNTVYPIQDFVVVPLEPETVAPILATVLPEGRFMRDVIHVQIEKAGRLEFGAYDNFHPDCVSCSSTVWAAVGPWLLASGVLRDASKGEPRERR